MENIEKDKIMDDFTVTSEILKEEHDKILDYSMINSNVIKNRYLKKELIVMSLN